jgi:hypothetical protein
MLVGEIVGAHYRPPADEISNYGLYFISGPFLTIGVGMYLGYMTAALLCVAGRAGLTRLLVLLTTAYAACIHLEIWFGGYPRPRLVLGLFVMLGVLASLATIRTTRSSGRRLIGYGAAFVASVGIAVLVTKPVLDWSLGTITTSGNVAFMALATALPFICAAALIYASLTSARRPGWLPAAAVTIFPLVVFCTKVNQIVTGPNRSDAILLTPSTTPWPFFLRPSPTDVDIDARRPADGQRHLAITQSACARVRTRRPQSGTRRRAW